MAPFLAYPAKTLQASSFQPCIFVHGFPIQFSLPSIKFQRTTTETKLLYQCFVLSILFSQPLVLYLLRYNMIHTYNSFWDDSHSQSFPQRFTTPSLAEHHPCTRTEPRHAPRAASGSPSSVVPTSLSSFPFNHRPYRLSKRRHCSAAMSKTLHARIKTTIKHRFRHRCTKEKRNIPPPSSFPPKNH